MAGMGVAMGIVESKKKAGNYGHFCSALGGYHTRLVAEKA
jgi:hypothetical protein